MEPIAVSVKTAAQMTDLSETTIRDAINAELFPAHRCGRKILIRVPDLETWIESL